MWYLPKGYGWLNSSVLLVPAQAGNEELQVEENKGNEA